MRYAAMPCAENPLGASLIDQSSFRETLPPMPTSNSGYRLIAPPSRPRRYRRVRSLLAAALCVAVIGLPGASVALVDADDEGDVTQDTAPVPAVAKMNSDLRLALANTPPVRLSPSSST